MNRCTTTVKEMAGCGDVKIPREAFEADPLWREERAYSRWEAWLDLVRMAACEDRKEMAGAALVDVRRGELLASERQLAGRWGWSRKRVRSFLGLLIDMGRIQKRANTGAGCVFCVVGYEAWVTAGTSAEPTREPARDQARDREGTRVLPVIPTVSAVQGTSNGTTKESVVGPDRVPGRDQGPGKNHRRDQAGSAENGVIPGLFSDEEAPGGPGWGPAGGPQRKEEEEEEKRKVAQKKKEEEEEEKKITPPVIPPKGGREEEERALFEAFWKAYPKRAGSNSKQAAWKAWRTRRREGAKPEEIMAGLERYRAYLEATGKIGTEYVMMASTFLGPNRRWEDAYEVPSVPKKEKSGLPWYLCDPSSDEYIEGMMADIRRGEEMYRQYLRQHGLVRQSEIPSTRPVTA